MELRHLRYFVVVAEEENVSRAAARLHISQPPLTRQIKDLEKELGVELFARKGKSIRLTDAGALFVRESRACLERVEQAIKAVRGKNRRCEIHLGYAPSPSAEILPDLLRRFSEVEAATVVLHDHSSPEMLDGLREGRLQAAVMMQPAKRVSRGVVFHPMREYPVGVAVRARSELAGRKCVSVEEVERENIVGYSRDQFPDYHEFLRVRLGRSYARLNFVEECDSGGSLAAAVEAGRGLCIAASFLTAGAGHRLKFVPFRPAVAPAVVGLAHLGRSKLEVVQRLAEICRS